jgi:protein-S-isoprenylcysteine O-methyltransferase Ste14
MVASQRANLLKSILHNLGVVAVGFGVAFVGSLIDSLLGLRGFGSAWGTIAGSLLVAGGFLLRVWATFHFYEHRMKVISLEPQQALITSGPYRFSRNPLYLGGNVFIFFGAALVLGSPTALIITAAHLPLADLFIRREEHQLERRFGQAWLDYTNRVRRWI